MSADGVYSVALLAALLSAAVAFALVFAGEPRRDGARRAAAVALASSLLSLGVHVVFGHRPGSAEALGPFAFVTEHRALAAVVLVSTALFVKLRGG